MAGAAPSADEVQAARRRLTDLINGYQASAVIGALARLGVADALATGPLSGDDLAARTGADPRTLSRILDATAGLGLITRVEDGRYGLTELGELLRADVQGSLKRLAVVSTEDWRWAAYGRLDHALRTGEPGFVAAHGSGLWDYLAAHPEAAACFTESLERLGAARDQALVATVDLAAADLLVDVGGGSGGLVCAALAAHPDLRAVLFDLPGTLAGAREQARALAAAGRCELVAGDFREAVPPGGDVYVLSWILHDWDDATARGILQNCRSVMPESARLLVVEMVVPEPGEPAAEAFARLVRQTDLEMLAVVGGRERTAREYGTLFAESGFTLAGVTPLPNLPWSVIEAAPA